MRSTELVPSLETCRALAAAGFPQDAVFSFDGDAITYTGWKRAQGGPAAPTLAEVLAALPAHVEDGCCFLPKAGRRRGGLWYATLSDEQIGSYPFEGEGADAYEYDENAVEAAARLYLALHSADLLPVAAGATHGGA